LASISLLDDVRSAIARLDTDAQIRIEDSQRVSVRWSDGDKSVIVTDNLEREVAARQDRQREVVEAWIRALRAARRGSETADPARLWVTMKDEAYVRAALGDGHPPLVVSKWRGDIYLVLTDEDHAGGTRVLLDDANVKRFGADRSALFDRAFANVQAAFPDRLQLVEYAPGSPVLELAHPQAASFLLVTEFWRAVDRNLPDLVAAVPAAGRVLVAPRGETAALEAAVDEVHTAAPHPISASLLRLSEAGWEFAKQRIVVTVHLD
jgi:hypothetical protein